MTLAPIISEIRLENYILPNGYNKILHVYNKI